jgi:hypothetical protein
VATFPDLSTFDHFVTQSVTADPLVLPIRGRTYSFDPADLTTGAMLMLQRVEVESVEIARKIAAGEEIDPNVIVMNDDEEAQFGIELIGKANLDQMSADGVKWPETQHVMATLMAWYLHGDKAALAIWSGGKENKPADPPARAASTKTAGSSTRRKKRRPRSVGRTSSRGGTSSKRTSTASTKSI